MSKNIGAGESSLREEPAHRTAGGARRFVPEDVAFVWGVGIESSSIPHLDVDQFEGTQHNQNWRTDLQLAAQELGLKHLRYSIPWHYIQPKPNRFDWALADERISHALKQGLSLIMDVMHFGTPLWLSQAVGDPEFPEALERLTEAMVSRYRGVISTWCPLNEPLVTALFSGDFGFWPPHSRKWRGYFPVLARVGMAVSRSIRAIRAAQPEAIVLLCDAADHYRTRDETLQEEVKLRNLRRFLLLDLIGGRVDSKHPLFDWVCAYGMTELDLQWFRTHPQTPDVIGLDYYSHSDWQLERDARDAIRQRRADKPAGLYGVANDYFNRYCLPMMVTETSIEGKPINREVWLERVVDDTRRLRQEGVPLMGLVWWPLLDHLDWDGALTHRIGKLHQVGLYKLVRQAGGLLQRVRTPLATSYSRLATQGNKPVGDLEAVRLPLGSDDDQLPLATATVSGAALAIASPRPSQIKAPPAPDLTAATARMEPAGQSVTTSQPVLSDRYGILAFSHLRWGFVWQRPQQFLSRLAMRHPVLFIEEPWFDLGDSETPRVELHQAMPNVAVAAIHMPRGWTGNADLPQQMRALTKQSLEMVNEDGEFDSPLLWYYNPSDAAWTLGHFRHIGVVYDCMDELSQFTGAPASLTEHERWLMKHADVVFTGGYSLRQKKARDHDNVHFFGCGVEVEHFGLAMDESTAIPPDIDFIDRPILGWFGVIDERVDYRLIGEVAQHLRDWSLAMLGPVVKVDPNLLPHSPNLYWMGGRDYSVLPNYCKAFDVCMMCFARNDSTEFINPTKALEYLATGRPVISTAIPDVIHQYSDLMDIVSTPQEFIAAAERAIREPDRQRIQRGLERARQSTWESVVEQMERLIGQQLTRPGRRSAVPITPLQEVRLEYRYAATPGS